MYPPCIVITDWLLPIDQVLKINHHEENNGGVGIKMTQSGANALELFLYVIEAK